MMSRIIATRDDTQSPLAFPPRSDPWVDAGEWNVRKAEWVNRWRCMRSNAEANVPMPGKRKLRRDVAREYQRAVRAGCKAFCGWR